MSLGDESFKFTCSEAESRGITLQQLIRAVIIPEWMEKRKTIDVSALARFERTVRIPIVREGLQP